MWPAIVWGVTRVGIGKGGADAQGDGEGILRHLECVNVESVGALSRVAGVVVGCWCLELVSILAGELGRWCFDDTEKKKDWKHRARGELIYDTKVKATDPRPTKAYGSGRGGSEVGRVTPGGLAKKA